MNNETQVMKEFELYAHEGGRPNIGVIVKDETVWTTQKNMSRIFGVSIPTINEHIQNILKTDELDEDSVIRKFRITASDGKDYDTFFYNLDMIISVGYRVNSIQATHFRRWATTILREFTIKGFALDDDRLKKNKTLFGKDYFDELIERIKEIRASERRFYQKITDIYSQCSYDYDPNSTITETFFATVQNKIEYAITNHTAAEIIKLRASHLKPNMGLTTWSNAPTGKILKKDVGIAKNYLAHDEMRELNSLITMYLDYAELQAQKQRPMSMQDWVNKLDAFLKFNEYDLLKNTGTVKSEVAKAFAENEYEKFRPIQDMAFVSDFDKLVKKTQPKDIKPLD